MNPNGSYSFVKPEAGASLVNPQEWLLNWHRNSKL
jgi:hypothetical protein